jgi:hypothetical protein
MSTEQDCKPLPKFFIRSFRSKLLRDANKTELNGQIMKFSFIYSLSIENREYSSFIKLKLKGSITGPALKMR